MCNCGNKRNQFISQQSIPKKDTASMQLLQQKMFPDISFEYKGLTALSVKGIGSGKTYRFKFPGDIQKIDYRDAPSMMRISVLKKLYA